MCDVCQLMSAGKLGEGLGWECNYIYVSVYITVILHKLSTALHVKDKDDFSCAPLPFSLVSNLEKLSAEMLARVAEHGHAQVVMDPQQQVREHPPGKNVRGYNWAATKRWILQTLRHITGHHSRVYSLTEHMAGKCRF
jgi:hypothetical protein